MDWRGNRTSGNIEDRRGSGGGGSIIGGGIGTILLFAIVFFLGGDPMQVLDINSSLQKSVTDYTPKPSENDEGMKFVSTILASTEDVWHVEFEKLGGVYKEPVLVLFSYQTMSECGGATASSGPFYCPADKKVYLDLSFFDELNQRYGVNGNFADAYVIAHEVGHHVQDLLGIASQVRQLQSRASERQGNQLSVMLELQADFLAGYWARRATSFKLTQSDIESALNAANAIGDDRLQKQSQGYVVPDAFTHGTSKQRMEWFMRGYNARSIDEGDTFRALQ